MNNTICCKACVTLAREKAENLAAALSELFWPPADTVGLYDNDDGTWRVEAIFTKKPDEETLNEFIRDIGGRETRILYEDIPDEDWVALSQAGLHPVEAGRFFIHGSHDRAKAQDHPWAIEIDAAQAFGTAHHGSTYGCLQAIDALGDERNIQNVLDVGTGTGLLAIAAAKIWQADVLASDNDPVAIEISGKNVRLNDSQAKVSVLTAKGLDHSDIAARTPYDLIIANILARPLISMAQHIEAALRPGGFIILSGITREQAECISSAYEAAGFLHYRQFTISDWVTLTLRTAG